MTPEERSRSRKGDPRKHKRQHRPSFMNNMIAKATEEISLWTAVLRTLTRTLFSLKEEPEASALPLLVKPGAVCLDIGAGYGRFALRMSRLAGPSGGVYSFEPGTYSRRVLEAVKAFYRLRNVTVLPLALSEREGAGSLEIPVKKSSKIYRGFAHSLAHLSAAGSGRPEGARRIQMTTVDRFVRDYRLPKIDFIKCDVEGAEPFVLQGALETLKRDHPPILLEIYRIWLARYGKTAADIQDVLGSLGYQPRQWKERGLRTVEKIDSDGNYFFV